MLDERTRTQDMGFPMAFASALLDPQKAPPSDLGAHCGKAIARRFNVYRNNVVVSLIEALRVAYPAVERLTGPEFFRAMARFHIRETPPTSPLLFEYGRDFPDFIDRYPYAQELPWLGDMARVERAWIEACHAQDALPLAPTRLSRITDSTLDDLRFVAHPASRIVRSRYAATTLFTLNRAQDEITQLEPSTPEDTLITRPSLEVEVRHLPPGAAVFLSKLIAGEPLGAAVGEALDGHPSFDLAANIAGFLEAGVFSEVL
jgi:hypothetical protein